MSLKLRHIGNMKSFGELDGMPFTAELRDDGWRALVGHEDDPTWQLDASPDLPARNIVGRSPMMNFVYASVARYREWQRGILPA